MAEQTDGFPTLLDAAKVDAGLGYPIIMEAAKRTPEIALFPFDTFAGTEMSLTVNTALPSAPFRNVNEGVARSNGIQEERIFQCFNLDQQLAIDDGVVRKLKDPSRKMTNMARLKMAAIFLTVTKQIWGSKVDSKGFPGMIDQYLADTDHEVDATGTTNKSSVWLVALGPEELELLGGNDRSILFDEGDWKEETVYDANNKPIPSWTKWIKGDIGLRLANKNAAVRIKNLGTGSGKGLTDDLLYSAYEKFTTDGYLPTHLFMNPRSQEQLRKSRTNTGSNVKGETPPLPDDWNGLPIVTTAGITSSES